MTFALNAPRGLPKLLGHLWLVSMTFQTVGDDVFVGLGKVVHGVGRKTPSTRAGNAGLRVNDNVVCHQPRPYRGGQSENGRLREAAGIGNQSRFLYLRPVNLGQSVHRLLQDVRSRMVHVVGPLELRGIVQTEVGRDVDGPEATVDQWSEGPGTGTAR